MANWKVQLQGEESTLTQLAQANQDPAAHIVRDGVDWFLESSEFAYFTDHLEVKQKATEIIDSLIPASEIALGAIYRLHYDNSKTVYK